MSRWWDIRCELPDPGYRTGRCGGYFFRVNERGDIEAKCHRCHKVQVIGRETLDRYRVLEYAAT